MKAVVTGGAGFIGSHIVEKLLASGHAVTVLDNFSSGKKENLSFVSGSAGGEDRYTLIEGDIRDPDTCLGACEGAEAVFHQAALRSVPKSMETPEEYNAVNIDGTLNMLKAAREHKVKRFVFASSSSVYGDTDQFPEKEDMYPLLISPYALSKLAGEFYCRIFNENFGVETVALRYFNVFGPRQALDDEYAVVIPKFTHCILNDQQPPIFGNGEQSRDFTYVANVVRANLLAASVNGVQGRVFNVANGSDVTILELVEKLNKIIGTHIEPQFLPVRPGDVFKTLADVSALRNDLGLTEPVLFDEGLERTVEFFRSTE
ncbi:MAG: NAD-dependent epimerase/dehydratase family protein [Candidatus Omnitrophica bacterium]|nr:NAD-dependent epimerase/dehydratase family protein [Candidatus Omnitrophota bacterium]